jgi:hypothetical protein
MTKRNFGYILKWTPCIKQQIIYNHDVPVHVYTHYILYRSISLWGNGLVKLSLTLTAIH